MGKKVDYSKPYKFNQAQLDWLEALESGEYKKTIGALCNQAKNGNCSYCCLGVASELFTSAKNIEFLEDDQQWGYDGEQSVAPDSVVNKLKLHYSDGTFEDVEWNDRFGEEEFDRDEIDNIEIKGKHYTSLVDLNDDAKLSFKEIAKFIRKHPRMVFRD